MQQGSSYFSAAIIAVISAIITCEIIEVHFNKDTLRIIKEQVG